MIGQEKRCCLTYEQVFDDFLYDGFFETGVVVDSKLDIFCKEGMIEDYLQEVGESIAGCFEIYLGTAWYMATKGLWNQNLVDGYKKMLDDYTNGEYDQYLKAPIKDKKYMDKHISIVNKYIEKHENNQK